VQGHQLESGDRGEHGERRLRHALRVLEMTRCVVGDADRKRTAGTRTRVGEQLARFEGEQVGVAGEPDAAGLNRLAGTELAGQQCPDRRAGLDDEVRPGQWPLPDFETALVDAGVDHDVAEVELVTGPELADRLGHEGGTKGQDQ